jgi:GIY-YIG catalytic domain
VASHSRSSTSGGVNKPARSSLPAEDVQDFRRLLKKALNSIDARGAKWADAQWGVYAFYDYDGEPIYVGQTNEKLRVRIQRHLTNQRTDAVAMRILDIFEVAEIEMWPLWDLEGKPKSDAQAKATLNAAEYSAYLNAIGESRFGAILNEKIPPASNRTALPPSLRMPLISDRVRAERSHPDIRIGRRAETVSRLAAVARERGEVSPGLRRVLVIQAVRLAYLSAVRLAYAEGRDEPDATTINIESLVGSVLYEHADEGETDQDDME